MVVNGGGGTQQQKAMPCQQSLKRGPAAATTAFATKSPRTDVNCQGRALSLASSEQTLNRCSRRRWLCSAAGVAPSSSILKRKS